MKIIWNPAVTLDGYIAKLDGDSDWVSEEDSTSFHNLIRQCGCVIVGHRTYEQYKGDVFPVRNATTFVWSRASQERQREQGVEYVRGRPDELINVLAQRGFRQTVLAGGTRTNSAFVAAGLVDEIIANIYPLTFGEGIKLIDGPECQLTLALIDSKALSHGVVQHRYKVVK